MKSILSTLSLSGFLLLAASQVLAQDAGTNAAAAETIRNVEVRWNREFAAKDLEKMLAHYTEDATVMSPGEAPCAGKAAIRSMLQQMMADDSLSLQFRTARVQIAKSGELGWSQGSYTLTMTDPETRKPITSTGSYVTVYRKEAGQWKAVSDIASPGPSAAPPAKGEKQ